MIQSLVGNISYLTAKFSKKKKKKSRFIFFFLLIINNCRLLPKRPLWKKQIQRQVRFRLLTKSLSFVLIAEIFFFFFSDFDFKLTISLLG